MSELNARADGIKRYTHEGKRRYIVHSSKMRDLDDRNCFQCVGNARKTLATKRQVNNG